jgi:tryptophan synthase beta chain
VANVETTHYVIGSVVGPAPFPALVRDLQRVIGDEAREQALTATGSLPARLIACVGGGSNAIGAFTPFLADEVALIGVEAGGEGLESGRHGASLQAGREGVLHGTLSSVLSDEDGQILEAHSISAGLDYPGVGPEHAFLRDSGRARYVAVTDRQALLAFRELCRLEGIIPALESAHALAWLMEGEEPSVPEAGQGVDHPPAADAKRSTRAERAEFDLVVLSGRGDKDLAEALGALEELDG